MLVCDYAVSPSGTQWIVSATLNTVATYSNAIGWGNATYAEMGVSSTYTNLEVGASYLTEVEYGNVGPVTFYGGLATIVRSEVTFMG